jgi:hypothetical protein
LLTFPRSQDSGRLLARLAPKPAIESFAILGHVFQELVGLKAGAVFFGEALSFGDKSGDANTIHEADCAAGIGREAPAKDGADVGVARIGQHAFFKATRGF